MSQIAAAPVSLAIEHAAETVHIFNVGICAAVRMKLYPSRDVSRTLILPNDHAGHYAVTTSMGSGSEEDK